MAHESAIRRPPIVVRPPNPSTSAPATLIFIHGYNDLAKSFNNEPPDHLSVAYHIHKSPALQHVKVIIPEALPCIHASIPNNVWYNIPVPVPQPGNPAHAEEHIEFGHSDNNTDDMNVTLDYFEELIRAEVANGTAIGRIVLMGYSQGGSMAVLFLQTRRIAADLGAVISFSGFHATDLQSVFKMQRGHGLSGRWCKKTGLYMMHGGSDTFIPMEMFRSWVEQLEGFRDRGEGIASVDSTIIDGVRHSLHVRMWPHIKNVLETVIPERLSPKIPGSEKSMIKRTVKNSL